MKLISSDAMAPDHAATALLRKMRETPMRRGGLSRRRLRIKRDICWAIESQGVPPVLAQRIAFQLIFKFDDEELGDQRVWTTIGAILRQERSDLVTRVGLADRQIVAVLPKLSARQVEDFLEELQATDRRIARTILNAALEAAEPLAAGRRYLAEYRDVAGHLQTIDPRLARTLANATFTACAPRKKATELHERFAAMLRSIDSDGAVAEHLLGDDNSRLRRRLLTSAKPT